MGLRSNRAFNSVHPYLQYHLSILKQALESYGVRVTFLSGFRTYKSQQQLWDRCNSWATRWMCTRPVAAPGCSQHNWGYAMDMQIHPPGNVIEGIDVTNRWSKIADDWARQLGLVTVKGDPNHVMIFPGAAFRPWAIAGGYCSRAQDRFHFTLRRDPRVRAVWQPPGGR